LDGEIWQGLFIRRIKSDGSFGEWLGYYGMRREDTPALAVLEARTHRAQPLVLVFNLCRLTQTVLITRMLIGIANYRSGLLRLVSFVDNS